MATNSTHHPEALYIDGTWVNHDDVIEVTDLADGGIFAAITAASPDQAERALTAADQAKEAMRDTTLVQRSNWLEAIADEIDAREEDLAEVIVREAGKPITSARGEVASAAERFRRAAEETHEIKGDYVEGTTAGHEGWEAIVKPEPVGTVLCIAPYNYPLATTALQVAPAIAAGNSVVLKPSSETPISAAILTECIETVGLPDGAFNFVPGRSGDVGDQLAGDARINAIAMTGSSPAGKHVAYESGMVNLHMELGGNAPAVMFPDADIDAAVTDIAKGSFKYAGQRCSAVSRVLAHEAVHDEVVEQLTVEMDDWEAGDLFDEDTMLGPLIHEAQAEWVEELVADALDCGADLVRGGDRDGAYFEPTLLANVPHDARILYEEQFGPVAVVSAIADEAEALRVANASDLALDAAVFTADYDRARRVADRLDAGAVRINGAPSHGLGDIPFGGNKESGIGREGLGHTIEAFTRQKSIIL